MEKKARYRAARKHGKFTQVQLAEKAGLSQQMVSKLEKGKTTESTFDVKIALACGIRAEWLGSEEGEMVGSPTPAARPANSKLKADLEATNNALAALATAARSIPKLGGAFLAELHKMPDDYKSRGIYAVLIGLLEHGHASQATPPKNHRGPAARGSGARKRA